MLWAGFYGYRCYGPTSTLATAIWNMATGVMDWLLLWLPVLWTGFYSSYCCLEYGYQCCGLAPIATGVIDRLLLWLPLPGLWLPVLRTGFYGPASAMATATWNMLPVLWTGFCYDCRRLDNVSQCY